VRRLLKIVALAFFGFVLLLAGWIGYRFIVDPEDTKFALAAFYVVATANHNPPPIAASGVLQDGPNWMMPEPASSRFTAILRKSFPMGSSASTMRASLAGQGFEPDQETACRDMSEEEVRRNRPASCSKRIVPGVLRYDWGGIPCSNALRVYWAADSANHLTKIFGRYDVTCL